MSGCHPDRGSTLASTACAVVISACVGRVVVVTGTVVVVTGTVVVVTGTVVVVTGTVARRSRTLGPGTPVRDARLRYRGTASELSYPVERYRSHVSTNPSRLKPRTFTPSIFIWIDWMENGLR
jgi:hypothetical protein